MMEITISCRAWKIIIGRSIVAISAGELAITLDITTPCARDFFEPQKVAVIVSCFEKCKSLAMSLIM